MNGPGDATAPARLQPRRLPPDAAADLRRLHGAGRSLLDGAVDGSHCSWRFSTAPVGVSHGIDLAIGGEEPMTLALVADQFRDPIGERDWWDYPETTRLLSWTLAHESLLGALGRLFGETPQPRKLHTTAAQEADNRIAVGFTVESAGGAGAQGRLSLPAVLMQRLLAHPGWRNDVSPKAAGWEMLPTTLSVRLPPLTLSRTDLLRTTPGDVLIVGARTTVLRSLRVEADSSSVPGGERWIAQADGIQLTLLQKLRGDSFPAHSSRLETRMNDSVPPVAATPAETPLTPLDQLPVTLDFEVGQLSVTLGELAALRPGYVFELPAPADALRVTIRANGRAVGRGELVAIGDVLGVQLTVIEPPNLGDATHGNG